MNNKFTKKELSSINFRWNFNSQLCWNYERMQGLGYLTTMIPVIEKFYGDNEELRLKALKVYSSFFNCNTSMGNLILGMNVAIEEHYDGTGDAIEIANYTKTSLMGPLASVGDTLFGVLPSVVFGSIAASMAIDGSAIGIIIWEVWMVIMLLFRTTLFDLGYKQGSKIANLLTESKDMLVDSIACIGLMVVGCMIATMIKFPLNDITVSLGLNPNTQQAMMMTFPLQQYVDSIMPSLLPLLITIVSFWLLGKKWMNSNRLIIVLLIFSALMALLNVAG